MIKTIIFDFGGVLLDIDMQRTIHSFEALGLDAVSWMTRPSTDNEVGGTLCHGAAASKLMDEYQTGKISTEDFLGDALKGCDEGTTWQQVVDAWNDWLLGVPVEKLEFARQLRKEGYRVYLLSNTNEEHWRFMLPRYFPQSLDTYFDGVYLSQELGIAKPDLLIFPHVLNDIEAKAEECLYIDDTKVNCEAAQKLGIHTQQVPANVLWSPQLIRQHLG